MSRAASRVSIIFVSLLLAGVFVPAPALAQNPPTAAAVPIINYNPQVPIPGTSQEARALQQNQKVSENLLGQYVVTVYRFGVWLAITLAIFMMMVGGFLWVIAGGNPSRVENAKSYITAALTGLVVALTSFLILQTVNPDIVIFKPLKITRLTNLAAPSALTAAQTNYGCPAVLVVSDPLTQCEQACQAATGGPALRQEDTSQPYYVAIPRSTTQSFCCACKQEPCLQEGKTCALASGARCCRPMVCNTQLTTCQQLHEGGSFYKDEWACQANADCLSGMCYEKGGSTYDWCVPYGGFPENYGCNRDEQCQQPADGARVVCTWVLPKNIGGDPGTILPSCHRQFPTGEWCGDENKNCLSGACDLGSRKCL